jgi:hypothetical protein
MQLGDTPEETRAIWRGLPPLYWMIEAAQWKPGVRVLAENPAGVGVDGRRPPVIAMQYVGAGKVLFHATDETWRWRRRVGDAFFARYWIQTIRWLARAKLSDGRRSAELSTDRREYRPGDPVRLRVEFADERAAPADDNGVAVVLERQGRKTERVQLHRSESGRGTFEGVFDKAPMGNYHGWIASPVLEGRAAAVDFTVSPPPGEFARLAMDASEMRQAAEETKGRFYTFTDADRLLADLPPARPTTIETLPPLPLWNSSLALLLFLGLLIGEWIMRKRGGMA